MTADPPGAWRVPRGEASWPARLEHLHSPPHQLWVRGALPSPGAAAVAVVGSRRPTPGGLLSARDIGFQLAVAGIVVVSGLARGIDAASHRGALDGRGCTVAVLGCGIDLCYPREHLPLRNLIAESGCVVSEDGGDAPPDTWRFPRRNRIIAALAEAVIVVEASEKSGALSTARWAADLGREVLAVPGSIRNASSRGSNLLIRDGARPFLEIGDLFESVPALSRALVARSGPPPPGGSAARAAPDDPGEDSVLRRVLDGIGADPVHPDDLAAVLDLPAADLMAALTSLSLRGAITDVCGGRVARTF
ncbi:MAG: DNA-protecting protein DprA [Candidatus Dormibacteraeota bacterium]|uniref:DNA-protecting protein DprA n=1 Tax=Candidatus Amunia macphersoniae TaxID=3127014 RepID=A0A934KM86_9BACT|nr:DNA-protecting protein DprA [Candidatus Dormibacteraeota bacterium]